MKQLSASLSILCILAMPAPGIPRAQKRALAGQTLTGIDVLETENLPRSPGNESV